MMDIQGTYIKLPLENTLSKIVEKPKDITLKECKNTIEATILWWDKYMDEPYNPTFRQHSDEEMKIFYACSELQNFERTFEYLVSEKVVRKRICI